MARDRRRGRDRPCGCAVLLDEGPGTERPFTAEAARSAVLDADGAAALARDGLLLDARAPARYAGEVEPVDTAAGHIPRGSTPTSMALDASGRFLGPDELARR